MLKVVIVGTASLALWEQRLLRTSLVLSRLLRTRQLASIPSASTPSAKPQLVSIPAVPLVTKG